jgi:hypothetical protein
LAYLEDQERHRRPRQAAWSSLREHSQVPTRGHQAGTGTAEESRGSLRRTPSGG